MVVLFLNLPKIYGRFHHSCSCNWSRGAFNLIFVQQGTAIRNDFLSEYIFVFLAATQGRALLDDPPEPAYNGPTTMRRDGPPQFGDFGKQLSNCSHGIKEIMAIHGKQASLWLWFALEQITVNVEYFAVLKFWCILHEHMQDMSMLWMQWIRYW